MRNRALPEIHRKLHSVTATVILLWRALVVGDVAKDAAKTSCAHEDATTSENGIALIIGKESLRLKPFRH